MTAPLPTNGTSGATPTDAMTAQAESRLMQFTRSELFARTFREGMDMVEEAAAYLDGPGR